MDVRGDGEGFGVGASFKWDNDGIADGRLAAKRDFQIFWINVETGVRDDDVFLAAAKAQVPICVKFA